MTVVALLFTIWQARAELIRRATIPSREHVRYWRDHRLDHSAVRQFAGSLSVLPIGIFEPDRFDFGGRGDPLGAVVEALDEDGETVVDLVAWPLDAPDRVLTMFGRASVLGLRTATDSTTYVFGRPLAVHRTPLDWLKAGCNGCVVVVPRLAARLFNELPGDIAPQDAEHAQELARLLLSTVNLDRIVLPMKAAA
jgi:hypothetical protein